MDAMRQRGGVPVRTAASDTTSGRRDVPIRGESLAAMSRKAPDQRALSVLADPFDFDCRDLVAPILVTRGRGIWRTCQRMPLRSVLTGVRPNLT